MAREAKTPEAMARASVHESNGGSSKRPETVLLYEPSTGQKLRVNADQVAQYRALGWVKPTTASMECVIIPREG